jgi:FkbM family methyltransferase
MQDDEITLRVMGTDLRLFLPDAELDHVQSKIRTKRELYEIDLLQFAATLLQPGDVVIDVGAYIGTHSVFFAAVCGASVTAIEPNPHSCSILRRNCELNRLEARVRIIEGAAGAADGRGRVETPSASNRGDSHFVPDESGDVKMLSLDSLELPRTRLVKIDVQGSELAVLQGAATLLERDRPMLFVEASDLPNALSLAQALTPLRYTLVAQFGSTPTFFCCPDEVAPSATSVASLLAQSVRLEVARYGARGREAMAAQELRARSERKQLSETLEAALSRIALLEAALASVTRIVQAQQHLAEESNVEIGRSLRRVESQLITLRSARRPQPARNDTPPARSSKKGRSQIAVPTVRKLRKLMRNPDAFLRDSKISWLKRLPKR